ncbi:hypothetical protein P9139_00775 [Curtobacterium flaccumfaciens]|nr:hypothetical protein P9139_00775 [Curtobacterium flaccumfaciens]
MSGPAGAGPRRGAHAGGHGTTDRSGLGAAALYVEGDNEPALALYRRSGFAQYAIDVQYAAP